MDSSDQKTRRALVLQRPRLLNTEGDDAADTSLRPSMLATLEKDSNASGTVASARRRGGSKRVLIMSVAAVLSLGAALFGGRSFEGESALVMSSTIGRSATRPQSDALTSQVTSAAPAASMDSPARIEAGAMKAVESPAPEGPSHAGRAATGVRNPLDRLAVIDAPSAAAATTPTPRHANRHQKDPATRVAASTTSVGHADAKGSSSRKPHSGEDDPDTELVAALIARLDRRGATPTGSAPASKSAAATHDAVLADRIHACESKTDLIEARQCRNKVCEKQWGKSGACPALRSPTRPVIERVEAGEPG